LKVLHRLGYDVVSTRDSEHFTPLERAVANYSYDSAEYLSEITDRISINYLATKTDSKGIIRLITKVK
jgi:ankyrin repeat protein